MSASAYLNRQNRTDLEKLADFVDFEHSKKKFPNKGNLATALDEYLQKHRDIFANAPALKDYYSRLAHDSDSDASAERRSPRKKSPAGAAQDSMSTPRRSTRRQRTKSAEADAEDAESTDASDASTAEVSHRKPRSPASRAIVSALPPTPRALADAIDEQTTAARNFLAQMWEKRVTEHVDDLRSSLSSIKAIETLITLMEAMSMMYRLVPWRYFFTTPPSLRYIRVADVPVKMPDVFVFLTGSFWAPFLLWLLTSLGLPLTLAYFFNISLRATFSSSHGRRGTRREAAQNQLMSFDPFIFNITKALICYLVYAQHFTFFGLFSDFSVERVNHSLPGQWVGMVTGATVGVIGSLYEAILYK